MIKRFVSYIVSLRLERSLFFTKDELLRIAKDKIMDFKYHNYSGLGERVKVNSF